MKIPSAESALLCLAALFGLILACSSDDGQGSDGTESGGAGTGGFASTGAITSTGSITNTGSATNTSGATTGDYDTDISEGEFSFFVVSMDYLSQFNGGDGLGGDLGGLEGADEHCRLAAQRAQPGDNHLWRAFLSTSTVDAIDRIGTGPWYSAYNEYGGQSHLVAQNLDGLANQLRPAGSTAPSYYGAYGGDRGRMQEWPFNECLTNEFGICILADGDTHDVLTGSGADGRLLGGMSAGEATCDGWTNSTDFYGAPGIGHGFPQSIGQTGEMAHWIATHRHHGGCGIGMFVGWDMGGPDGVIGTGGGYGGWHCFAYSE